MTASTFARKLLYFLENKLMHLYLKLASSDAPIFEQPLGSVPFSSLKRAYLKNYLAHKNGSPIKM